METHQDIPVDRWTSFSNGDRVPRFCVRDLDLIWIDDDTPPPDIEECQHRMELETELLAEVGRKLIADPDYEMRNVDSVAILAVKYSRVGLAEDWINRFEKYLTQLECSDVSTCTPANL